MIELDRIDVALLEAVQLNSRLTSFELSQIVNLSPAACQRRLRRLRNEGVIEADISVVAPKAVGRVVTVIALVTLEHERSDAVDRFKSSLHGTREVMMGYHVTGDADFVLVVTTRSMDDWEQFTRRFYDEYPDVTAIKALVVMDRVKASLAIPIDIEPSR